MTIIVEDGTGLSTAETLTSVAEADTYHLLRGNTAWAALSTSSKEMALRKANDYLRQAYRNRWQGKRVKISQSCDWPRYDVLVDGLFVSSTSVPSDIKDAAADLALRSTTLGLNPDQSRNILREKVDVLEVEYVPYAPTVATMNSVEDLLRPYLTGSRSSVRLVRS